MSDDQKTGRHRLGNGAPRTLRATLATMTTVSIVWTLSAVALLLAAGVAVYISTATARTVGYSVRDLSLWMELRIALEHFAAQARESPPAGTEPDERFAQARTAVFATFDRIEALQADPDFDQEDVEEERSETVELRDQATRTSDRIEALRAQSIAARGEEARRLAGEIDHITQRELEGTLSASVRDFAEDEERDMARDLSRATSYTLQAGGALALVVLATLLGSLIAVRRTSNRLAQGASGLVAAAVRVGEGRFEGSVQPAGIREFDDIALAFNAMSRRIQQAQAARLRAEKLAAIGQLAAGVSHELRNPLGAIRNALYLVKKRIDRTELAHDAGLQKALAAMDSEGRVCNKIVTDLLDFAREKPLQATACPLRPLVDAAVELVPPREGVEIVNAVPEDLPIPDLDRDQYRQVLINLIQNASDAIPERRGGSVRVEAEAFGDDLQLRVSDDGTGIPEDRRQSIFEPLFTTKKKGTGLGLPIVATIVRRHGGRIEVDSTPGRGTTFSLHILRSQRQPPEPSQET